MKIENKNYAYAEGLAVRGMSFTKNHHLSKIKGVKVWVSPYLS